MSGLTDREPSRFGDYQVVREIARGGMATVYEAADTKVNDRRVAIKALHRTDAAALARFRREVEIAARLRHDNIVPIYTVGDGWLAMPLIEGATLDVAARERPLRARIAMLHTVAGAVAHAHAAGVVHRDLKPQNVLVESGSRKIWLTDFGLAQAIELERLTASGARMGTLPYMAPEQVRGERARIGPATDVWALGIMLYELVGGSLPFTTVEAIERDAPPEIVGAPPDLRAIWLRALSKDESARHADALAFAEDLRRHLAGEPVMQAAKRVASGPCPYCSELVRADAVVCPRCRGALAGFVPPGVPDAPAGKVRCTACGYVGPGEGGGWGLIGFLFGLALCIVGVVPGVIYFALREGRASGPVCPRCGATTVVRGPDTLARWITTIVLVTLLLLGVGALWWYVFLAPAAWRFKRN